MRKCGTEWSGSIRSTRPLMPLVESRAAASGLSFSTPRAEAAPAFEASTMNGVERFFVGLTVIGFTGLFATLGYAGLLWIGAVAAGY